MLIRFPRAAGLLVLVVATVRLAGAEAAVSAEVIPIRLRAVTFDPLSAPAPDLESRLPAGPRLRAPSETLGTVHLVQLDALPARELLVRLERRGVQVLGYVPERTWLLRLPHGMPGAILETLPGKRFVGPLVAGYKMSPELGVLLERAGARTAPIEIDVVLYRGEDPDALVRAVRAHASTPAVVDVKRRRTPRVSLEVGPGLASSLVGSLLRDPAVAFVDRRLPVELHNDQSVWIGQSYDRVNGPPESQAPAPRAYPLSATLWAHGLTGAGQVVAVSDTGLEHAMCFFEDPAHVVVPQTVPPPAPLVLDPAHRKVLALNAPLAFSLSTDDSYRHGTHTSASAVGDDLAHPQTMGHDHGDGMAPDAKLVFEDLSGSVQSGCSTSIIISSVEDLLQQERLAGAHVSTNSWGSSAAGGQAAVPEGEAAEGAWDHENLLVVFSAGNDGGGGIGGFAACKNCLTVGAGENYDASFTHALGPLDPENMTELSSRGPTSDGRIKPDLVAPGYLVESARFPVQYVSDSGDPLCDDADPEVCLPAIGGCFRTDTSEGCATGLLVGTSQSAPIVAGLAALARQYFVEGFYPGGAASPADARVPTAALLKAVLVNGARNMTGRRYERRGGAVDFGPLADAPSMTQGWGRVMLDDALYFGGDPRRLYLFDLPHASGLRTAETVSVPLAVGSSAQPLKLTLVWSDAPSQALAFGSLVNDLDLELVAPDGTVYRGNQWTTDDVNLPGDKQSAPSPAGKDATNNVEGILILAPPAGLYTLRVTGAQVPGDPGSVPAQGAALVATGDLSACTAAAAPQNPTLDLVGTVDLALAWDAVPGAVGYRLYRNRSTCGEPMAAEQVIDLPAVNVHTDASLEAETTYNYTVRAVMTADGCETVDSACVSATTGAFGPPAVPDGIDGSAMTARRRNASGTAIDVNWDVATCPAVGTHLIYGPLADVAIYGVTGARCGLGTSGSAGWSGVPAGDLWFLIVADDLVDVEGSWGTRSDGSHRNGTAPSLECGFTVRNNSPVCP